MSFLSAAYGRVARARRTWYERRPDARRRLPRPVISVGNLVVGGSGKTPVVATVARLLVGAGERPAVLSRGYARRQLADGVVVVSDGTRVIEPVERSGDEPQMLARALPGVPVLVSSDRYLAGCLAVRRFGSTVLLLDDGFQHLQLARDVDLLLIDPADLDEQVLPSGRLRESLSAGGAADALLVAGAEEEATRVSQIIGVPRAFTLARHFSTPRMLAGKGDVTERMPGPIVAAAGIARPSRFFDALRAQGWHIAREIAFPDHHWFTEGDLTRMSDAARDAGSALVVMTEKDVMRLDTLMVNRARVTANSEPVWAYLPMDVMIEPAAEFASWLRARL